jgi:predicted ribosomally synthesized peptide with SipW-like signal peptide
MSRHLRREPRPSLVRRLRSPRLRALLGLGVLLGVGATGTFAFWTDEVTIAGTSLTAGTIDLLVNADVDDDVAASSLTMSAMVPGSTSAEVLTVKNNGTAPMKYTLNGGLGAGATDLSSASALKLSVRLGGAAVGGACTGGAALVGPLTLTTTPAAVITPGRPLAATGTETLCFQVTLDPTAPSSLQGKTATATFTFTGTSDVS